LVSRNLIEKSVDEYPILSLSQRGKDFLKKQKEIQLPKGKSIAKLSPPSVAADSEYDRELFEELRLLRKNIADEKGIPPYVVFGDLALRQMAFYLPQSEENFARISGVGREKLGQYGQIFIDFIQTYAKKNDLREKDIPGRRSTMSRRVKRAGSTYQETKKLVLEKMSIEEMAGMRGLAASTITAHIEKLISFGEEIDIDYLRPSVEKFKTIKAAFQKSGGTALSPVREMLGQDFSYEELRVARLFIKS
jgi:ATP-dependent DNA helicase RecQ